MGIDNTSIASSITQRYLDYYESQIHTNRFTHKSLIKVLERLEASKSLSFETIGYSEEGREIKSITYGKGKTKLLLWSQMHGNESTATRAILDLFNFLIADDKFNVFRKETSSKLTLQFIPMLNPDGTDRFQRRTATEIDINRDATKLQSPEGKLLMQVADDFKPDFAFNLHDQRRFYNVTDTKVPSSMSFLAPAYNVKREVNTSRGKAMQVIAGMNAILQAYIPNGVGLYDDTYSHRSFGDCIQAKGISTILIESGWLANDMEKEAIRKLNFTALLGAFEMIIEKKLDHYSIKDYESIPAIDTKLFDVLIKNVKVNPTSDSIIDIGINRYEHLLNHPFYYAEGLIDDLGDLSKFYGFKTIKAKGLTVVNGKTKVVDNLEDISSVSVKRLLNQGILFLISKDIPYESHVPFPINMLHPRKLAQAQSLTMQGKANFLLIDENGELKFIVLNGFVMKPNAIDSGTNGMVIA